VPLKGYWFDRTQEYAARNRGEEYGRLTYATEETFVLSQLPCWEHFSPEEYRKRVAELIEEIELSARVARMERGISVQGTGNWPPSAAVIFLVPLSPLWLCFNSVLAPVLSYE
jgi:hypothetical protein